MCLARKKIAAIAAMTLGLLLAEFCVAQDSHVEFSVSNNVVDPDSVKSALDHLVQFRSNGLVIGSGFLASRDGHVITAHHVVQPLQAHNLTNPTLTVFIRQNADSTTYSVREVGGELVGLNPQYDIAIYRITDAETVNDMLNSVESVRFGGDLENVESVLMLGPCNDQGTVNCFKDVSFDIERRDGPYLYAEKPVDAGFSGGPAFGDDGSIVGVVLGKNDSLTEFNSRLLTIDAVDRIMWSFGIDLLPAYGNYADIFTEVKALMDELKLDLIWSARFERASDERINFVYSYRKRFRSAIHPDEIRIKVIPIVVGEVGRSKRLDRDFLEEIKFEDSPPRNPPDDAVVTMESPSVVRRISANREDYEAPDNFNPYDGVQAVRVEIIPIFEIDETGTKIEGRATTFEIQFPNEGL